MLPRSHLSCRISRIWVIALLATSLFSWGQECLAWSAPGHQIVGATADEILKGSRAEQEVRHILGGMDLKTVSVWADCVRGVAKPKGSPFTYTSSDDAYPECSVFSGRDWTLRMINYARANWEQCKLAHDAEYCHDQYHYTDISTFRNEYKDGEAGSSKVDIVHSISAAIAVLGGYTPEDSPFVYPTKLEALMLLTHFVGDIHQPLHVAAIYLDANGHPIDPDQNGDQTSTSTAGGNFVSGTWKDVGKLNWHAYWDSIPEDFVVGGPSYPLLVEKAKHVRPTVGGVSTWSEQWADDTIGAGKPAFTQLSFAPADKFDPKNPRWTVLQGVGYEQMATDLKFDQLAKAGARLAQLLRAIWPDEPAKCESAKWKEGGYLGQAVLTHVIKVVPSAPRPNSPEQMADEKAFEESRAELLTARGRVAAHDDVWETPDLVQRFSAVLGIDLRQRDLKPLYNVIQNARVDADNVLLPVKKNVCAGGRVRPFVAHPVASSCLSIVSDRFDDSRYDLKLIKQWQDDINRWHLDETGSYPSGHALAGELVANILAEIVPEHAKIIRQRGIDFGNSRLVCGFHYPSDLKAGRVVADALFNALKSNKHFREELENAKGALIGQGQLE